MPDSPRTKFSAANEPRLVSCSGKFKLLVKNIFKKILIQTELVKESTELVEESNVLCRIYSYFSLERLFVVTKYHICNSSLKSPGKS